MIGGVKILVCEGEGMYCCYLFVLPVKGFANYCTYTRQRCVIISVGGEGKYCTVVLVFL